MSKEIKAIKVDGEVIAVGMGRTLGITHKSIAKIEEYNTNDPRNGYSFLGYCGKDENGELIFDIQTNSAIVLYK